MKACERAAVKNKLFPVFNSSLIWKEATTGNMSASAGQYTLRKARLLSRSRLLFDRLFDNLVSRERNYCFGKMAQKSPEFFIPKIIFEAWHMKQRSGAPNGNFRENICSEDYLRTRIFGTFVVKFFACLPFLGFSNIYKMV